MRQTIGNGWHITHLTDRTVQLEKESADYRRLTGRDGFVFVRGEPGIPRSILIDHATEQAVALDAELARRIAAGLLPTQAQMLEYMRTSNQYLPHVTTFEEPATIGRKGIG